MLPAERRLGAHLPLGLGMVKAVDRAAEIGANAIQVFADNPTAWRRRLEPPKELPAFRQRLDELGIAPVAIHASYLINLAGPDERFFAGSIEVLANELRVAPGFQARFVNVHIGSHRGTGVEAGTARLADGLCLALAEVDDGPDAAMIALENSAGGGFGLGRGRHRAGRDRRGGRRPGHRRRRGSGSASTRPTPGAPGSTWRTPTRSTPSWTTSTRGSGCDRLVMIHLNDSKSERGSRLDRHEHVGAGRIGAAGLGHLLRHPRLAHAAYYLETPGMDEGYDAVNMARARDLLAGRPLADLPPEAMELRGSRARTAPAEDAEA